MEDENRRMRVLQVARQFYPSLAGVENSVEHLCLQLIGRGHRADVVTLDRCFYDMQKKLPARDNVRGIEVFRTPFWGRQRLFLAPGVLGLVRRYDLVHIHNVDSFAELLVATKPWHKRPLVLSTHGGFFHTTKAAALKRIYFNSATRLTLRGIDAVIAVSEHDRELFAPICPSLVTIPGGIDFPTFAKLEKTPEPGLLVYVGRIASNKRLDRLLDVFAGACMQRPEARLAIVGADYEGLSSELRALARKLGIQDKVIWAGPVDHGELLSYMCRAHLFVSASQYEAFGISMLEAMASATVPVVHAIPASRAVIEHGENGFLADFSRPDAAAVLTKALSLSPDHLRQMGERAKRSAEAHSWDNAIRKTEDVYCQVLARRRDELG